MKKILFVLTCLLFCSCTYNEYNVTGDYNKLDGTITAEKKVNTDFAGSGYGSVSK